MKDKIEQIVGKVESGHLEPKEAVDELFALCVVGQQRELLLAYEIYNASEDDKKNNMEYLENLVDTYLANNCG
jgi:hypothetical protein